MPHKAAEIEASAYARILVMGAPKSGKSVTVGKSAPGPVYIINSDDQFSLRPLLDFTRDFEYDFISGENPQAMITAITAAHLKIKKDPEETRYKTVIWDTITKYVWRAEDVYAKASMGAKGEPDGRRYHPLLRKHVHNILDLLFALPCHVIVNTHWAEVGGALIDEQLEKKGEGVAPMLPGQLRVTVPAAFQDVIFLEKPAKGDRVFITSSSGVWGPGCRSLPGVSSMPADISLLWAKMQQHTTATNNKKDTSK